ncbi:MAG TPA: YraN family protein [Porticoccaceae bacterium]|nr:YraN family protein [Porticoccaceae bacterium]HCO60396.1 YraN family protein [Porticoccaceae bacterium]
MAPGKTADLGAKAEQLACKLLRSHGLKIKARNYRTRRGEVDIIAEDGETLVFVEVRLRSNARFGGARESITPRKQQRIILASQHYLQQEDGNSRPCRFDTICLDRKTGASSSNAEWIKDAFSSGAGW